VLVNLFFSSQLYSKTINEKESRSDYLYAHYVYASADLNNIINKNVFVKAVAEYNKHKRKKSILTIIDYTIPSNKKRFFVIDMKRKELIYMTYTSHGVNTDINGVASQFSNTNNSHQSSLGTFITAETYIGKNGYSLKLDGLVNGYNNNARKRYIVIHGSKYTEKSFISKNGSAGLSEGCPAIPKSLSKEIINTIKSGSIIYSFGIDIDEYNDT